MNTITLSLTTPEGTDPWTLFAFLRDTIESDYSGATLIAARVEDEEGK